MSYDMNNNNLINTAEGKIAKEVAQQCIMIRTGRPCKVTRESEVMLRLVKEMEAKHESTLNNICNKLHVDSENAERLFHDVSEETLRDGINWGRITAIYAFGIKLAEHSLKYNYERLIEKIAQWVGSFVASKSTWIRDSGKGWGGFLETFYDAYPDRERNWFQGVFSATVGLGALAAAIYMVSSLYLRTISKLISNWVNNFGFMANSFQF